MAVIGPPDLTLSAECFAMYVDSAGRISCYRDTDMVYSAQLNQRASLELALSMDH